MLPRAPQNLINAHSLGCARPGLRTYLEQRTAIVVCMCIICKDYSSAYMNRCLWQGMHGPKIWSLKAFVFVMSWDFGLKLSHSLRFFLHSKRLNLSKLCIKAVDVSSYALVPRTGLLGDRRLFRLNASDQREIREFFPSVGLQFRAK